MAVWIVISELKVYGSLVEWFKTAALKTADPKGSVSSNLTASAKLPHFRETQMKLSELGYNKIHPGIKVIGAMHQLNGEVTKVEWNPDFKVWDGERNPWITITWSDGSTSCNTIDFMDRITVIEEHEDY